MSATLQLIDEDVFQAFQHLIYTETGIALNESKRYLLSSRLAKRLLELRLDDYLGYYEYILRRDPDGSEMQEMINCITTNKTEFFREPHHFDYLATRIFPELARRAERGGRRRLRIWSAAASHGHEAYSVAIAVREFAPFARGWDIRILASDIDTHVLRTADEGIYDFDELATIGEHRLRSFFLRGTGKFAGKVRAKPTLRDLITFRQINLVAPQWPIHTTFDVILCRNVMIYFDLPTQRSVIEHLVRYLSPGGYLMLGHSESIPWSQSALRPLGNTIFQRVEEV